MDPFALRSMDTFPRRGSFSFGELLNIEEKEHKREKRDEKVNRHAEKKEKGRSLAGKMYAIVRSLQEEVRTFGGMSVHNN